MNGAAIPLVMVAVALLFGGSKKKKKKDTTNGKDRPDNGKDRPDYDEGGKRDPAGRKKRPGEKNDSDLDDEDYDPEFYDEDCGPGWVNIDGDCLWLSEFDAPNVPKDGVWIAPDCAAIVVGADWWDEVAIPQIEEWVDLGFGGNFNWDEFGDDPDIWWETASAVAYMILEPYDLGPIDPQTGKRDTDEMCLDLFPFSSPDFEWYANNPRPLVANYNVQSADTDEPEWQAYFADLEAWSNEKNAYWADLVSVMPGVAQLFTQLQAAVSEYYNAVWE